MTEPTCGDCGKELTLVRPGKHQCDNPNCIQNNSKPESKPSEQKPPERHYAVLEYVSKGAEEILRKVGGGVISKSVAISAMQEFAQQSMKQERERAIQECIEVLNEHHDTLPLAKSESDNGYSIAFANAVNILEKLKK